MIKNINLTSYFEYIFEVELFPDPLRSLTKLCFDLS